MTIMIAIPCMGTVPVQFAESLLNLQKPEGTKVCFKSGSLIYDARNLLSLTAIENNFDYIMWMDSDMTFPTNTITRLLQDMNDPMYKRAMVSGPAMVSGLYVKRTFPVKPVIYNSVEPPVPDENGIPRIHIDEYTNYPHDNIFPVEGCGFGCVLTPVSLIKQVWDKFGPAFTPLPWAGEDISFCYRVNQLLKNSGQHIYCDSTIKCGHIGQFLFTEDMLKRGDVN